MDICMLYDNLMRYGHVQQGHFSAVCAMNIDVQSKFWPGCGFASELSCVPEKAYFDQFW